MDNFDQKIFTLKNKLSQITPKQRQNQSEVQLLQETLINEKQETFKIIKQWEYRLEQYDNQMEEYCTKLYNIEVQRDNNKYIENQKLQDCVEQLKTQHQRHIRQTQREIHQQYCNVTEQITSETKQTKLTLKQIRQTVDKQMKNLKKIINQTNLNINYDKHYYKKLTTISQNQQRKKQKLKSLYTKIHQKIDNIEKQFTSKLMKNRKVATHKDQKCKRILQLISQLF